MKSLSAFKNYSCGEPTCRLYVKNIAKQVEVKVLFSILSCQNSFRAVMIKVYAAKYTGSFCDNIITQTMYLDIR